jgi:hypothetical protein
VVVHRLGHQWIALRPVIAPAGDQPDAHGVAAGHEPEAVVLDLVNPVGAGRRLVGRGREAGFVKLARSAASRLRIRSIHMPLISVAEAMSRIRMPPRQDFLRA